jgi:hypothetical protein|tara:strand:+ start:88 stop:600 length:513 start_codon:yes stop_codon:yes gene_type:complete
MLSESELIKLQTENQQQQQNLSLAHSLLADRNNDHFDKLITSNIPEASARQLGILLAGDLALSNLQYAKVVETEWMTRIYGLIFEAIHPRQESCIQGDFRAFLMDSEEDCIEALDASSKLVINEILTLIQSRINRSLDGWQQEKITQTLVVSETKSTQDDREAPRRRLFG